MRFPLPLLSACLVLAAAIAPPPPVVASEDQYLSTGLTSCGGRDEAPCGLLSEFFFSNGGVCDRGLVLNVSAGKCVNDQRRQGVGNAFQSTWVGRAMRIQRRELNWTTPVGRLSLPTAHNAFSNNADGYAFDPNQKYSLTELLDAGIRSFAWDIHSGADLLTGWVPELCHGLPDHAGCVLADRDVVNIIKELRDWYREGGHENEVVFIWVQDEMDANRHLVNNAVAEYLDKPGIGVFGVADRQSFLSTLGGTHETTARNVLNVPPTTNDREWPSQEWLTSHDKRVLFMNGIIGAYSHDVGAQAFVTSAGVYEPTGLWGSQETINDWTRGGQPYPTCSIPHGSATKFLRPLSGAFYDIYGDDVPNGVFSEADAITPDQIAELTECNVDTITFDRLLDENYQGTERLARTIWSWDTNQPPISAAGHAARLSGASKRWTATPVGESNHYLCRVDGVSNPYQPTDTSYVRDIPTSTWLVTHAVGPWAGGHDACAALTAPGSTASFAPPRNGFENAAAAEAVVLHGASQVWLNFASSGGDSWFIGNRPALDGINAWPTPLYSRTPLFFSTDFHAGDFVDLRWNFGDGHTSSSWLPVHSYDDPGTYQVTAAMYAGATLLDQFTQTITVLDGNDTLFGAQISIAAPTTAPEGTPVTVRLKHSVLVSFHDAICGDDAQRLSLRPVPLSLTEQEMVCLYSGGPARQESITVMVRPLIGDPISQSQQIAIHNLPPGIGANPISIPVGETSLGSIWLQDAPDETLSLTVKWGDGTPNTVMSNLRPGQLPLQHHYASISPGGVPYSMELSLSDEALTTTRIIPVLVVGLPPSLTLTGPSRSSVGNLEQYTFSYADPDGGAVEIVHADCGSSALAGTLSANALLCRFTQASASNSVTVMVRDDDGQTTTKSVPVKIGTPPDAVLAPLSGVSVEGGAVQYRILGNSTDFDHVTLFSVSCGSGTMIGQTFDDVLTASLDVRFVCRFADGPQSTDVSATVRDVDGDRVETLAVSVVNAAPSLSNVTGPAGLVQLPQSATVTATASDPGQDVVTTTVNWGDGSASHYAGLGAIVATHAWNAPGIYTVTVQATDEDGASSSAASMTVTVADTIPPAFTFVPPPVTLVQTTLAGTPYAPAMASAVDSGSPNPIVSIAGVPAGNVFPVGVTTLTYVAADASGNHATATTTVTVVGNTPAGSSTPVQASDNVTVSFGGVEQSGFTHAEVIDPATAGPLSDAFISALVAYEVSTTAIVTPPITLCFTVPLETDQATFDALRVLHAEGGVLVDRTILAPQSPAPDFDARTLCAQTDSVSPFVIAVRDVTPPSIESVTLSQPTLSPPNHRMVSMSLVIAAADNVSVASCSITAVTSNEPINGTGDGDLAPDWSITGPTMLQLRAERSGSGNGRIYTVTVRCSDAAGNGSTGTASVMVPKGKGK